MAIASVNEILTGLDSDSTLKHLSSEKSAVLELVLAKAVAYKLPIVGDGSLAPDVMFSEIKQKAIVLISSFSEKYYVNAPNVLEITKALWCARYALVFQPELVETMDIAEYAMVVFQQRVPEEFKSIKMPHHHALFKAVSELIHG